QAGRLAWHREDCARLVDRAQAGDNTPPLSRVKGAGRLDTPTTARLDALARWRDEAARQSDLPRRFVISDEKLIELAQASEDQPGRAIDRLPGGQRRRFGQAIEAALDA